jgi:hypothetical protein
VLPEGTFASYLAHRLRVELVKARKVEVAEAAALAALSEKEREAKARKDHVITRILDQRCPECHALFAFEGDCFALKCMVNDCSASFCGYCFFKSPGGNAHLHTGTCMLSDGLGLYGGHEHDKDKQKASFALAQNRRRVHFFRLYLSLPSLLPAQRQRLLLDLVEEVRDYELGQEFAPEPVL